VTNNILTATFWGQLTTFVIILAVAWLLQLIVWRLFKGLRSRVSRVSWAEQLLPVTESAVLPLFAWLLNWAAINAFQALGWPYALLHDLIPLLSIWFLYRLGDAFLRISLRPSQARAWSRKVLLPIAIFFGLLYSLGWLNSFLQLGFAANTDLQGITVGSVLAGLVVIAFFFLLSRAIWRFLKQNFLPQLETEPDLAHAVSTFIAYIIIITGVIVGLGLTGVNLTALTVILGGLSIGLGFGLQELVNNFVSGFILMFERSIGPGDIVEIEGKVGMVQDIGIRRVIIKTPDNKELIVPNSSFLTNTVTNLTRTDTLLRIQINVGVAYAANPREVEQALLAAAYHPAILDDPSPMVQFREFGESSLDFALLVWVDNPARVPAVTSDLRYRIWDELKSRNIEIPYPQREVYIKGAAWLEKPAEEHNS
jgi:small-conductance mechanosensitive channel